MGSNTSTSTDTKDIYLEQQYVESIEDKYAELLRQNELLRRENELLKLGNYNLKRDNDNLRGDVNNLRLVNKAIEAEKEQLEIDKQQLDHSYASLLQKLPRTNLLPKVAEKEKCYKFMKYCTEYHTNFIHEHTISANNDLTTMMNDSSEYLVYSPRFSGEFILLITNKGKSFVYREQHGSRSGGYDMSTFQTLYLDFEVREMNETILNSIIVSNELDMRMSQNGMIFWKMDSGHKSIRMASPQACSPCEISKMFR